MDANFLLRNPARGCRTAGRNTKNQPGFTLVEIVSVLIILSVLAAILIPRFIALDANSQWRGLDYGVAELNGRESLTWANIKLSAGGWVNDVTQLWPRIDTDLGTDYSWDEPPSPIGGTLRFRQRGSPVNREASTFLEPGHWSR